MSYYSLNVFLPAGVAEIPLKECGQVLQEGSNRFCVALESPDDLLVHLTALGAIVKSCECLDSSQIIETSTYEQFVEENAWTNEERRLLRRTGLLGQDSKAGADASTEVEPSVTVRGDLVGCQVEPPSNDGSSSGTN